jgi:hypothetical protein
VGRRGVEEGAVVKMGAGRDLVGNRAYVIYKSGGGAVFYIRHVQRLGCGI